MNETVKAEPGAGDGRKTKAQERTERQRDRILQAAKRCFVEHGFHAASMANISDAAHMSPGLIYRYFENKNAIILAIIDRQLQESRAGIEALNHATDFVARLVEVFRQLQSADDELLNPTLFLETSAQASRDPQIAQALGQSDRTTRAGLADWLARLARHEGRTFDQQEIEARALILQCLIEGLIVRAVREPGLDTSVLARGLAVVLPHLQKRAAT